VSKISRHLKILKIHQLHPFLRIRDETGNPGVLKRYNNKDITLTLPEGKTLKDIKWFSVWCDEFAVDFGNVMIPKNLEFPRPQKIGGMHGIHAVHSDNIVIVDAQTLLIPNFVRLFLFYYLYSKF
jgi:hypothetical protein